MRVISVTTLLLGADFVKAYPNGLRASPARRTAGCANCVEVWEPGSLYQGYSDGFCQEFNQCGGSTSQCDCASSLYRRPTKNYVFEKTSDHSSMSAYYPYNLPGFNIGRFQDGPGTRVYNIVNGTEDNSTHLADYSFTLQEDAIQGDVALASDLPPLPSRHILFTDTSFGFRVLQEGTYVVKVGFANDVHSRNGFAFEIRDRDYHPDQSSDMVFSDRFSASSEEMATQFNLETGHDYLLEVFGYISGLRGETTLSWTIERV